jgi:hypothetical protein
MWACVSLSLKIQSLWTWIFVSMSISSTPVQIHNFFLKLLNRFLKKFQRLHYYLVCTTYFPSIAPVGCYSIIFPFCDWDCIALFGPWFSTLHEVQNSLAHFPSTPPLQVRWEALPPCHYPPFLQPKILLPPLFSVPTRILTRFPS